MTKDTNWMVDLLEGKNRDNPVSNYTNLVNRRGLFDDIGDAFTAQSNQPAINGKQKMTNALMAGVGAGMKGSQTQLRESKLQGLENDLKEVVGYNVRMQKQLGAQKLRDATYSNYASKRKFDLKRMSTLDREGKSEEFNDLFGEMYNEFKNENPDLVGNLGNFVGVVNGAAVFEKGGKMTALPRNDVLSPLVSASSEEDQEEMEYISSLPMRKRIANKNLLQNLAIEKERAGIANQYSSANLHNAQADSARHEMNAPKETEKGTINPERLEQELGVLEQELGVLERELTKLGEKGSQSAADRIGSTLTPGHIYRLTPEQTSVDTLGQLTRGQMFKAFGYRNETEFEQIPAISSHYSLEQNKAIVQQYKNLYLKTLNTNASSSTRDSTSNKGSFDFSTIPGAERIK